MTACQRKAGHYSPIVSRVPAAPEAVVKPVKCSWVTSKCSGRCSCKAHTCNLACTELCKCAEDTCSNIVIDQNSSSSDDEENEEPDNVIKTPKSLMLLLVCIKTCNIFKICFWQPFLICVRVNNWKQLFLWSVFGVNGPEILLSQQMTMFSLALFLTPSLSPSPCPTLVSDVQQLILGYRSRNMLSEQFFIYTK